MAVGLYTPVLGVSHARGFRVGVFLDAVELDDLEVCHPLHDLE